MAGEDCYVKLNECGGSDYFRIVFDTFRDDDDNHQMRIKDKKFLITSSIKGKCFNFLFHDNSVFVFDRRNGDCYMHRLRLSERSDEMFDTIEFSDFEPLN